MAWSAPSEWERWDPDKLIVCPYNSLHTVPAKRYQYHVIKCRENYPEKDFVSCPFNAKHIMLRPELRRHITRCPDRGEVEPYSFKGNEQDSEGFYFKGNTSVPCYKRDRASRTLEEDWDRDDEHTTSQQNLCEYYANRSSLPVGSRQPVQDLLRLNPTEREQFKRNMRTQAVRQSDYSPHNQRNLPEYQPPLRGSSTNNDMSASRVYNRYSEEEHECLGSGNSTSRTTYSHQNNRHFGNATPNTYNHMGVARPEMRGVENSTGIPSFRGAGRAKLAEEARRMNFGLRRSGAPVGRGRGILDLFSSDSQG